MKTGGETFFPPTKVCVSRGPGTRVYYKDQEWIYGTNSAVTNLNMKLVNFIEYNVFLNPLRLAHVSRNGCKLYSKYNIHTLFIGYINFWLKVGVLNRWHAWNIFRSKI